MENKAKKCVLFHGCARYERQSIDRPLCEKKADKFFSSMTVLGMYERQSLDLLSFLRLFCHPTMWTGSSMGSMSSNGDQS